MYKGKIQSHMNTFHMNKDVQICYRVQIVHINEA